MENDSAPPSSSANGTPATPPQPDRQQIAPPATVPTEKRDAPQWTDIVIAAFTVALVFVSIVQAVIFKKQWEEMHTGGVDTHELAVAAKKQADEAKAQVDLLAKSLQKTDKLVEEATTQANATKTLAGNSQATLKATQDSTQLEQRAWLGLQMVQLTQFQAGKNIAATAEFLNTGKSPALAIQTSFGLTQLPINQKPPFLYDFQIANWTTGYPVAPQGRMQLYVTELGNRKVLSDEDKGRIERQQLIVWVWGTIRYKDIFGNTHNTRYCGYTFDSAKQPMTQGMLMKNCPDHSDMD